RVLIALAAAQAFHDAGHRAAGIEAHLGGVDGEGEDVDHRRPWQADDIVLLGDVHTAGGAGGEEKPIHHKDTKTQRRAEHPQAAAPARDNLSLWSHASDHRRRTMHHAFVSFVSLW